MGRSPRFRRASNGVNLMASKHVFRSVLLAVGLLFMAGCASQRASTAASAAVPATTPAAATLLEKKFQQAARSYLKFQSVGKTVYCKKEKVTTSAIPVVQCLSESELRLQVEAFERWRNPVQRPVIGTVSSIG